MTKQEKNSQAKLVHKNYTYHLIDDNKTKPRCGTRLGRYTLSDGIDWTKQNFDIAKPCPKCGSIEDFMTVSRELWQAKQAHEHTREQARIEAKKQLEKRLQTHRQLMAEFTEMLAKAGATITNQTEMAAGGNIIFVKDGLKFKLSGSIYND